MKLIWEIQVNSSSSRCEHLHSDRKRDKTFQLHPVPALNLFRPMKPALVVLIVAICLPRVVVRADSQVLTQAVQVLKLPIEEAQAGLPVRLRGTVISGHELDPGTAVIHDESGSIFIRVSGDQANFLARTNLLEISGITGSGEFAPIVMANHVRLLGHGEIPEPRRVTYDDLLMGRLDSQWVEVQGCLRSSVYLPTALPSRIGGTEAELATGGGRLVVEAFGHVINPDWVDGTLLIRGICFHKFNQKHQFYQLYLLVPEGQPVMVDQLPVSQPFDLPVQSIGSLLQFAQAGNFGHRVQVRGVLTYQHQGEFLYIQDADRGLLVRTRQDTHATIGDELSVVGFPAQGDYSPMIEDAVFQIISHGYKLPAPIPIQHPIQAFEHDGELVSGTAKMIGYLRKEDGWELSLQMDNSVFTALQLGPSESPAGPKFEVGSEIKFSGVCSVVMGSLVPRNPLQAPQSFRVLLRSEQDLVLIKPPPWWTTQRILIAFAIVVSALAACIAVVILIAQTRFQRQKMERLQAEAEFAAILKERNRLAREIHDTLAQDISGISAQLEVARRKLPTGSEAALAHLDLAHATARNSLQEARRTIWNMRSQVLEGHDLSAALSELLDQEVRGAGIHAEAMTHGVVRRLPSAVENDLLRIGQEAIHNAIRHAQPSKITLEMTFTEKRVVLSVRDDGCGYDPQKRNGSETTHFGLKGIRERVAQNGGRLNIRSAPGQGTEVRIEMRLV